MVTTVTRGSWTIWKIVIGLLLIKLVTLAVLWQFAGLWWRFALRGAPYLIICIVGLYGYLWLKKRIKIIRTHPEKEH